MIRRKLIFGVTGYEGTWVPEFLSERDYKVHGTQLRALLKADGIVLTINFEW